MARKKHLIVYRPPKPEPTKPPAKPDIFAAALRLVGIGVLIVGAVTLLGPWARETFHSSSQRPGEVCWPIDEFHRLCEIDPWAGWPAPDEPRFMRRRYVGD